MGDLEADVFIAGTGPVGATYARIILTAVPSARVIMADVGSQDSPIIGAHHKNSIKYQKDIDRFVNVINGALQPISIPPQDTLISTLGGDGWRPPEDGSLIFQGSNPQQRPEFNLRSSSITRAVGGMATHWTCACPIPHEKERENNPIQWFELQTLLESDARRLLNIKDDQFEDSVRQILVKSALEGLGDRVKSLPLGVERRTDNPVYVTWTGTNTVLGDAVSKDNFMLLPEHLVTKVKGVGSGSISSVELRDLNRNSTIEVRARAFVLCCGAVSTPQILYNSGITPRTLPALGHYLSEQSIAFCQIVLKQEYVDAIPRQAPWGKYERVKDAILDHIEKYERDPLRIPFTDPEPQITLPFSDDHPWHVQIHRDAFSYGDVGSRSDMRVVVDIRYFGAQEIQRENRVTFDPPPTKGSEWVPGVNDIYGMPQPTFYVQRSSKDHENDQKQAMMAEMTSVASILGSYLPGSYPQFMEPGLALHITGTTRIGTDPQTSVADAFSKVHGFRNLWVGGNGCIPDSTACNPTRTSVAIAVKGAWAVVNYVWRQGQDDK